MPFEEEKSSVEASSVMKRRCNLLTDYRLSTNALAAIIGLEILLQAVTAATTTTTTAAAANGIVEEVSCFNTIFSVSCAPNRAIVFDSARYGRNDTHLAARCGVPFSRHCDVDVHFLMNRACAGRRKCNVMVNTALFGDPCGYEEFLRITYQCIPVLTVHNTCFSAFSPTVYDHGYLSTPNYPDKYFMDADCTWRLAVQNHQTVRITIFDFELDLKRAGSCKDFLEISAGDRSYFKDCGILGKQVVEVNSSSATVQFVTGQSSLTQRGFFLYFEGVGPGCPNLKSASYGVFIVHFLDIHQILSANVSCLEGLVFSGLDATFLLLKCVDSAWTREIPDCVEPDTIQPTTVRRLTAPVTRTITNPASEHGQSNRISSLSKSASVIGFALGVISSVFFVVLLILIIVYCYMRRKNRNSGRNVDKWRVVINNLQENATKQEHTTYKHFTADDSVSNIVRTSAYCSSSSSRRPPAASNRSIPTSFRSIQAQHGCSALITEGSVAPDSSSVSEKRNRPTWIEVTQPYSPAPATECTCYGTAAAAVARYSSGRTDVESSVNIGAVRRTCAGAAGCRYVGRSRQTISPCCSHWGTVRSSCRSPVPPEAAAAAAVYEASAEVDPMNNSPDFVLSRSAPDLFTVTTARGRGANQLSVEGHGGVAVVGGSQDDELPSENETLLLSSPDDGRWLQRDNQALSPVSITRQFPVNDSGSLIANALKPYDKRVG